ncbi:shikimate dehydrogenase [Anaerosacchariphilus polymeriproducens]|uniref:Shikimate dehydrogenase (NADP(+)) n=1 Tax=Anaerosacchariphilus polymeriproducens TaxID=1812858 RepID=A0A371B0B8_9FIRM|nr:shikimate dehydrogenase [Anaerosacchariphilus polymeriproducens]RDU25233.1 shikimate dehydrogenase [Anaerosacchariphilus polymeriproducens]
MNEMITGQTRLTGLLGSPVAHSISPMMHNEAFHQLNLDFVYLAFDVSSDNLKKAVDGLRAINIRGFNVTMPHKNEICNYMDKLTPISEMIGAVNTVINDNGHLTGHTTDGTGYLKAVEDAGYHIIGKKMTLLGAGGSAASICAQAALDGVAEIDIYKRKNATWNQTQLLVDKINKHTNCNVSLYDFSDTTNLRKSLKESSILTNATSIGMEPNIENCPITDETLFYPELIVSDIIYHPKETKLLKIAKRNGCFTCNGLYMLLYQGAASFELWTGQKMPISLIKEKYFRR